MTSLDAKIRLVEFEPDHSWQHVAIIDHSCCQGGQGVVFRQG